jgi:hypothetical protein
MNSSSNGVGPSAKSSGLFAATHWSGVLAAGHPSSPRAQEALAQLLRQAVAQTIGAPEEIDAELRHLRVVLSG